VAAVVVEQVVLEDQASVAAVEVVPVKLLQVVVMELLTVVAVAVETGGMMVVMMDMVETVVLA
jgi:hypothetical protein